jgi:DNA-binding LacI/PurR family transcriptional regulator
MPTILNVAKLAGVSKTTVSRYLNDKGPVNAETADKIRAAIAELKYSPNYFAQGMRTSKTRTIGIIIPDYSNPFYPELLRGIEDYARSCGYMTQLANTHADPVTEHERLVEMVKRQIDGIVLCSYNRVKHDLDYLTEVAGRIPVILMDPLVKSEPLSYIVTDGRKATMEAVSYLVSIGRQRIGYIKGPSKHYVTNDRFEGYRKGLEANGLPFDKALVHEADFTLKAGFLAAEWFIGNGLPVDALMAATDLMAIGAIKALNNHDIAIPERIAVVGFDNISLCRIVEPSLTTIAQPINELGTNAARIIIEALESGDLKKTQLVMPGSLVIRKSTNPDYKDNFDLETPSIWE